jgi:Cd2+/Zn2+-exporting ATPase
MPFWAVLVMYLAPYAVIGYDVVAGAAKNIVRGRVLDEKFLMLAATVGAFAIGEYPEAVALMLFYQIGEFFQSVAVGKSRKSIAALMDIRPESATVIRNGGETVVAPEEVAAGETLVVRAGEKVPLDCVILEGFTTVDTSALTGESVPREKTAGDKLFGGSVNLGGAVKAEAVGVYGESAVSKILDLVENAAEKKSKSENFITRFAKIYTPAVVACAVCLAVIPPLILHGYWAEWIRRALVFLVVSCPCALVISVPLSFFGGIGRASRKGILIKGANCLETLAKVDTAVFDKTGTLTEGCFRVTAVHPNDMSEAELLDIAALAESYSSHPIAESIVVAHGEDLDKSRVGGVKEMAGLGVETVVDGKKVYVGNGKLMDKINAEWHECRLGGTVVHIAYENEYLGHIVISDVIKKDTRTAVSALKKLGVKKTVMLTGDSRSVAKKVADEAGVDEWKAELMPAEKVEETEKLLKKGGTVAFIGDGINDAPVLMRADVGIAMGALGSDAAIEAADIVLMNDKPSDIAAAVGISRKTMKIVRENIIFALAVKFAVLVLGAFGIADMWLAVFADVGVTVIAVLNAMRALGSGKKK